MSALVGLLVSYATLFGTAPAATETVAIDELCAPGGPACEAPLGLDEPAEYATPAEVDCPAITIAGGPSAAGRGAGLRQVSAFELPAAGGDCSPPSLDFYYRVSRSPESERPAGALRPQRARRNVHPTMACTGLPPEHGTPLTVSTLQPIAVYTVLSLPSPASSSLKFEWVSWGRVRTLEPLDRPPRA